MNSGNRAWRLWVGASVTLAMSTGAVAQQVVGGRALDNNLMVGSGGFNSARSGGYSNRAALDRPQYGAARTNSYTGSSAINQNMYYWSTGSAGQSRGYSNYQASSAASSGITVYNTSSGPQYNALANPLYNTMQTPYLIERGTGGGGAPSGTGQNSQYQEVNAAPALEAPRYRAYR